MPAEAITAPSGLYTAESTSAECRSYGGSTSRPVAGSHWRTVPSEDAVTKRAPSGLNAALVTLLACPRQVATSAPVAASHTRAVLSSPPVASRAPSGLKATAQRGAVWPAHAAVGFPVVASNTVTRLQSPSVRQASRAPSGLTTTAAGSNALFAGVATRQRSCPASSSTSKEALSAHAATRRPRRV